MSLRADAQMVLKRLYGGRLGSSEAGFTEEDVAYMLLQVRDFLMRRDIGKGESAGEGPDDSYFTTYDKLPVLWDEAAQWAYVAFPNGDPVDCRYDAGVWVQPVQGGGVHFVRAAQGWCAMNPEIAWCEGRHAWELRQGRIVFPAMPRGAVEWIRLSVIEAGATNLEEMMDRTVAMPAGYVKICSDEVLASMGMPADKRINFTTEFGGQQK